MASKLKQKVAKNLYNVIHPNIYNQPYEKLFENFRLMQKKPRQQVSWLVNIPSLKNLTLKETEILKNSQNELLEYGTVKNICLQSDNLQNIIEIDLKVDHFIKDVLESNPINLNFEPKHKKIIVEFSSPNIAKPFHVGHLRSTLTGNFLANIKEKLGNSVIKMNYLGDWGTQIGKIHLGVLSAKYTEEELKENPIMLLYNAYVSGNRASEENCEVYNKALKIFYDLENGDSETIELWNKYRNWTVEELVKTYNRLGVSFNEYAWESDYKRNKAEKILECLQENGILSVDELGRKIASVGDKKMPLIKSDNTTLYLIRDLMAIIDRKSKHKFDEIYYVVENGQSEHFISLFTLCRELKIDEGVELQHVKFGRMHGMSTRKGKVLFLKDILDEAKERVYEKQVSSKNTKIHLDNKDIADIVGVSCVIINDLKHHRKKDYEVNWENMIQLSGDTGASLQYCHCRLFNLKENNNIVIPSECDPEALKEPEAINLIVEMAKYEDVLLRSNSTIESSTLVRYLFDLCKAANIAFKVLNIKNSGNHVGGQRLLLFERTRQVLKDGMEILGLKPLQKM